MTAAEDEIARGVIKALRSEEGQDVLVEAMAKKLELTAGWQCHDAAQRAEIRKDMEFVRDLRSTARNGLQRVVQWALAIAALGFLSYIGVKSDFLK